MAAAVKAILISLIATAALFLLVHLAFFFPFYMTIVVETFNLANVAANDNYVKYEYWRNSLDDLQNRPMFSKAWDIKQDCIVIEAKKGARDENYGSAIGYAGESGTDFYYDEEGWADQDKPYRQRGFPVTVTVSASYPFEVSMWGRTVTRLWPVSFSITTIGLKYSKDLEYDYLYD